MIKYMKRLLSAILFMAITVVCCCEANVHAAPQMTVVNGVADFKQGNATIQVQGNDGQNLKGKTLMLYRLFSVENSENMESVNYSMNPLYANAMKKAVGNKIMKKPANVTEYEVIDYLQSLNNYEVEGAHSAQQLESSYSDYRYFVEELISEIEASLVSGTSIYVESTKQDNSIEIKGLEYGYYLVEDVSFVERKHSAISLSMLGTANPESVIHIKADYPTVIKKIQEDDNKETIGNNGWNDIADFEIGQNVPYKYESTVPNMNGYHTYYYAWHDKMDEALTLQEDSIQITISGKVQSVSKVYQLSRSEFNLIKGTSDATFVIEVENIKAIIDREFPNINDRKENIYGQLVTVSYQAILTEKAVQKTGRPGFENDVRLEFSNDPKQSGAGKTGFTPWDTVVCFTYRLNGMKINNYANPLEGAKFKLFSDEKCEKEVFVKKIGNTYCVINEDSYEGSTLAGASTITSNAEGKFDISGLDAGTYYLKEVAAPAGYRPILDPIVMNVSPVYTKERNNYVKGEGAGNEIVKLSATAYTKTFFDGEYKETDTALDVNQEEGSMNLSVVNEVGVKFPVTGTSGMSVLAMLGVVFMGLAWRKGLRKHE